MRNKTTMAALVAIALLSTTGAALAQAKPKAAVDVGEAEYKSSCAACHGVTGKGDGPMRSKLVTAPTDLTTLAKRNGGVLPVKRVTEIIDGRQMLDSHGLREMPVWGFRYVAEANVYFTEVPFPYSTEAFVRTRITALIDHLNRLQVK